MIEKPMRSGHRTVNQVRAADICVIAMAHSFLPGRNDALLQSLRRCLAPVICLTTKMVELAQLITDARKSLPTLSNGRDDRFPLFRIERPLGRMS